VRPVHASRSGHIHMRPLDPQRQPWPWPPLVLATCHTLEACLAYSLAVHSPSVVDVAGVARQLDRSPATGGLAMFVGMSASVAVVWVMLSMGSRQLGSERHHRAGCARVRAHGGAVGTARSLSW
jgi:hypothetical protein